MKEELQKIDIHNTESQLKNAIDKLKKDENISKQNKELIIKFTQDSAIGLTSSIKARVKDVGARARLKNLYLLKNSASFFKKKSFDKLDKEDLKDFVKALKTNDFKKNDGGIYSEQTKASIKKTLILMLRWIHQEGSEFYDLTKWIDTRYQKKDPDALTEEEILKMIYSCNTLKQKALVSLLYSLGCRIEEFLNIRIRDCKQEKGEVPYYIVTLRNEYSKTSGRDIDLLWKDSSEVLGQLLESLENKKPSEPIFNSSYDGVRKILKKIGERALNRLVTPHLIRHSSATYDASNMTHSQLCIKYGWSLSSNMPDIYIKRAGVKRKEIVERFKSEKFGDVKKQNEILKTKYERLEKQFKMFQEQLNWFDDITGLKAIELGENKHGKKIKIIAE